MTAMLHSVIFCSATRLYIDAKLCVFYLTRCILQGADGRDGRPGIHGKDGLAGKDGRDGKDFASLQMLNSIINGTVVKGKPIT